MENLPQTGDRILRFCVDRKLGQSSTGAIFLANDTDANFPVALKFIPDTIVHADSQEFEKFKREIRWSRRISHPGVCRLFDLHQDAGLIFLCMEFVEGESLQELLSRQGNLAGEHAVDLMQNVGLATYAAHEAGFVHGALKPGKIMLRGGHRVSVLDFGLSGLHQGLALAGKLDANYLAPEVLRGLPSTALSDIYSLGAILYESVTGRRPFEGTASDAIADSIRSGDLDAPSRITPDVTPSLEDAILKAMALDSIARFESTSGFVQGLGNVHTGDAAVALPWEDDQTRKGPWDGNIEKSVQAILSDAGSSRYLLGDSKNTTVLFSSMVDIDSHFDDYGSVSGFERIRSHHDALFPIVERYAGKLIKTIGDALVVCFDTPAEGAGAAIAMQRELDRRNADPARKEERVQIRIGLHSEPSVFRSSQSFGRAISLAAQIGAQAEGLQILVSAETRKGLNPSLHPTFRHSRISFKGEKEETELYTIEWKDPDDESMVSLGRPR
jgi:eukaryotic-like serine/threonine-protein kinase